MRPKSPVCRGQHESEVLGNRAAMFSVLHDHRLVLGHRMLAHDAEVEVVVGRRVQLQIEGFDELEERAAVHDTRARPDEFVPELQFQKVALWPPRLLLTPR